VILISELLPRGLSLAEIPSEHQKNLIEFHSKLQAFREKCGLLMVCSSGYRTKEHHEEIYAKKNKLRQFAGLEPLKIPYGSAHLSGHACDFLDPCRALADFVDANKDFVRSLGFHFEARESTSWPTPWLHIQDVSPLSGALWFQP
jgi:hypothetical protein